MVQMILTSLMTLIYFAYSQGLTWITACDGWQYGSISNVIQMQLIGANSATPFFYLNQYEQLPIDGNRAMFEFEQTQDIGDLYSIQISVDDSIGFCIKKIEISLQVLSNEKIYIFDEENYFGSGIILSNKCIYSYQFINENLPLIKCHESTLQLYVDESRGIYNIKLHSCVGNNNGMAVTAMQDYVGMTIMGKNKNQTSIITTQFISLDHYVPDSFNIRQLGDLIAGNVILNSQPLNALYNHEIEGEIIGIKLEIIDFATFKFDDQSWFELEIGDDDLDNGVDTESEYRFIFENGRYLIQFFEAEYIEKSTPINIYGGDKTNIPINVYIIFKGKEMNYSLPFIVQDIEQDDKTWFDANDACKFQYGTTLASIHNAEQDFLIRGFAQEHAWIGFFDLTLEKQNNWKWIDGSTVDYTNWALNEPNNENGEDCGMIHDDKDLKWNDEDCANDNIAKYVCSSPQWPTNTERIFEINVPLQIDDITLISINNDNPNDTLCIDSVIINDESAKHLSTNKIGNESLLAIYKYPVCKTEVVDTRVDAELSTGQMVQKTSDIIGGECQNNNRMIPSTCTVSQNFEFIDVKSFAISNEDSTTSEYSWGSSYSHESSFGVSHTMTWGYSFTASAEFFGAGAESTYSFDYELGTNYQWSNTFETNIQTTQGSSTTNTEETSWETSTTKIVECSGEISVPPAHSIGYTLIFNTINTTVTTYSTLRLTLCSGTNDDDVDDDNDEDNYVYIDDVPTSVSTRETSGCMVQFSPAVYVRNDHKCSDEQRLAIATGSTYIPRCTSQDTELYDGCQCDIGDSKTLGQCWCVDNTGNMIDGKLSYVDDGDSWKRVCTQDLKCDNSDVIFTDDPLRRRRLIDMELEIN